MTHRPAGIVCPPCKLEVVVIGFLAFEESVQGLEDIQGLTIQSDDDYVDVRLHSAFPPPRWRAHTSGRGDGINFSLEEHRPPIRTDDAPVTPRSLFPLIRAMFAEAQDYQESPGIHAADLAEVEKLHILAEEVGRHYAVDKVSGEAMLRRIPTAGKVLLTTGRVPSDMLRKGAHTQTPT